MELMIREDIEENVLGCLLNKPSNLLGSDVHISVTDFTNRFNRILYGVIDHLAHKGVVRIIPTEVNNFLKAYPGQYEYYLQCCGDSMVDKYIYDSNLDNFTYYYKTLKKIALINKLVEKGYDVSNYYKPEEVDLAKKRKIANNFENATSEEIIGNYESIFSQLRNEYTSEQDKISVHASEGLRNLVERLTKTPEMGLPTNSYKINTICRGRGKKKLYMYSAATGGGKSRVAMGDAGRLAIKAIYDPNRKIWVENKHPQPTLYISTEMEIDEIQEMILAYVTGINEEKIKDGNFTEEEKEIIEQGITYIENSPLYFDYMSSFTIMDVEDTVKIHKQQHNIQAVFFDYIHLNMRSASEVAKKMGLENTREDTILTMFAERLKALANTYDIHIHTSTQLNGDWEKKENPNQNLLRGAKALADKTDFSVILLPLTSQEQVAVEELQKKFEIQPNMVMHIYKNRAGQKNLKVYVAFDYGTCRMTDCFVTDRENRLVAIDDTVIQ